MESQKELTLSTIERKFETPRKKFPSESSSQKRAKPRKEKRYIFNKKVETLQITTPINKNSYIF